MHTSEHRRLRGQRGFTLIEVVVAFAIFALSAGALYETFAGATRRASQARDLELLQLVAQSVLAEMRARPAPWPPQQMGRTAAQQDWRITVAPFDAGTDEQSPWKAYEVTVYARSRSSGREAVLRSIELARDPP